ncbi:DUF6083 domain-containing protein [Streptomyces sp. NPDC026092]|uniref:DUF6083 domain-containing protein n=1 Tax=Streptomyces sp. NPDC026092 TaxID=3154797 RepID=UPI0033E07917
MGDPVLVGEVLSGMAPLDAGVPTQPDSGVAACGRCGARADWHRTVRGKWMLLEVGEWPVGSVPAGRRWRVAGDGTAVNLGNAQPSDTCRICHFDVCPSQPAPPTGSPTLHALWREHARRRGGRDHVAAPGRPPG